MRKRIQQILWDSQIRTYGYGNIKSFAPEQYSELTTAISFAVRLPDAIIDQIASGPTHEYFQVYRTINRLIDETTLKLVLFLQSNGYRALPIAASQSINREGHQAYSGLFSHRMAATAAGLGWIGKNNSLVTFDYGPRVRLGTILTNWDTEVAVPIQKSFCGECNLCVEQCPALALSGRTWNTNRVREDIVDVVACSNHMKEHFKHIGRGSVCGICISCCPVGQERV